MTITLPLGPQEEARLIAAALVREALDRILAEAPGMPGYRRVPS